MKLKSFGCSLLFGSDLSDCISATPTTTLWKPSHSTWPALIAQELDLKYECHARPAAGNVQILQRLLDELVKDEPSLFVIGWTWIDRFSYTAEEEENPYNPLGWRTMLPMSEDPVSQNYYRNLHSQFRDKLMSLICMKTAVDILEHQKKSYVMTCVDDLAWETKWHITPGMIEMQKFLGPRVKNFDGKNFLDWSKSQGYKISDSWHPLEHAHRAAADYALSRWGLL